MQAIEFEADIDANGNVHVPEQYRSLYGRAARFVVLLPDDTRSENKRIDPMKYSGQLNWPVDGMEYQQQARDEWD